ncbi:isopenicillin N synthase family dioxygenase [Mycolicibacterium hodleri]|uniref:Isopenicillin N synthase family oxygenase n=1 Tax=Mycolicibacterium hodleri TaxID=49897 RepID=A0A502EHN5_9MYCO|nr:2-oxoglutarate and iron-dependent oxygenase domain-containing protein [Mycolicibacterium hodleri]TPG36654.1 isopenicillin N synthase family oxygenase [Mycolicibacterium hodleri]
MSTAHTVDGLLEIPTIDVSAYRTVNSTAHQRDSIANEVDRAARTVGFMQIIGHGIPEATLTGFTSATDAFFALDGEAKSAYRCPPSVNRGYTPPKSEALANSLGIISAADLFEAFNIGSQASDHPDLALSAADYPENVWPGEVADFASAVGDWFDAAGRVARLMVRIFGRALGVGEDGLTGYTDHSVDLLRMINYRLPSADIELEPDQLGMGAHTDYGIVTVLWADAVPGLEILGADATWHPVQPSPGALLVNLGDALARWTNDRWISTMHRVAAPRVNGTLVPRRSAAYFHDGNIDAVIAPLPTCVSSDRPALYEPVTIQEHLRAKLAGSRSRVLNPSADREAARLHTAAGLSSG